MTCTHTNTYCAGIVRTCPKCGDMYPKKVEADTFEDDDEPCEIDDDESLGVDCMLMEDGQCMKAGSEECDFDCPLRNSEFFAGSKAWMRERGSACHKCGVELEDGQEPGQPRWCPKCAAQT